MSQFPYQNQYQSHPLDYAGPGTETLTIARFFNAVYAWMAAGLGVTAIVAWWASQQVSITSSGGVLLPAYLSGGALIGLFIAEIVLVMIVANAINKISAGMATILFLLYSALNGLTLSFIFLAYAHGLIFSAFFTTAIMFGVMSVYGYVTKTDLTTIGRLCFMALIGLIIASVVNFFIHSSGMTYLISYAGAIIFVGLTAYDTQKLKSVAMQTQGNAALAARLSIVGSLVLYLDFINLFLFILRIMGDRRR